MLLPAQAQVQVGLAGYALSPIPVETEGFDSSVIALCFLDKYYPHVHMVESMT